MKWLEREWLSVEDDDEKKLLSNNCYSKHTTQENLPTKIVIDLKKFEKNYMKKMKKNIFA